MRDAVLLALRMEKEGGKGGMQETWRSWKGSRKWILPSSLQKKQPYRDLSFRLLTLRIIVE